MALNQSITVMNEYTVKNPKTGKPSRGGTPGDYILRYMARDLATETVAPIRRTDIDDFIIRYTVREEAVEKASDPRVVRDRVQHYEGLGGAAFGYGSPSLSDAGLRSASRDIQRCFDQGKTVMKTVISFSQDYLVKNHLVDDEHFEVDRKGAYRGHLDQMKLRYAIMRGMERLATQYDDLRYTAVIQVDTEHAHCHLVMVDAGQGNLTPDGTQKGKLSQRSMNLLRRGIDSYLDEKQTVPHLSSAVQYDRRNVVTYMKRWTHKQLLMDSTPQFLIACLPEDKNLWRAGSRNKAMQKANDVLRPMVEEVLDRPGSPMGAAMASVMEYANERRRNEGLDQNEWDRLVFNGREAIVMQSMNSVYSMLRQMPDDALRIRTPLLDTMSMDYEDLAAQAYRDPHDDVVDFGFRLATYGSRLHYHREQREQYHELARQWETTYDAGVAVEESRVLHDFYIEEEEYHAMCVAKYQHYLPFTTASVDAQSRWDEVAEYGKAIVSVEAMLHDQSLAKLKDPQEAEDRGLEIYGQPGGHFLTHGHEGKQVLADRADRMRVSYEKQVTDLQALLANQGLLLLRRLDEESGLEDAEIVYGEEYPYEQVKGIDMHHMGYDSAEDIPVGDKVRERFVEQANERMERTRAAMSYLVRSGQAEAADSLPYEDIRSMLGTADVLEQTTPCRLPSEVARLKLAGKVMQRSRTIQLGAKLAAQMENAIDRGPELSVSDRSSLDRLVRQQATRRSATPVHRELT